MNNREYFNSVAEQWDNTVNHDDGKIREILRVAELKDGYKILDVGTGTGVMVPFLHSYIGNSGKIIAVDVAEKMIKIAKQKYSFQNVEYIVEDVLNMDFPKDYFDCIMCYSMFPHFSNKKAAIDKLAKHLNKDGKIVICHSQSREAINNLHKEVSETVKNDRLPSVNKITEYYNDASLQTITVIDNEDMYVVIGSKL